jgi:hypothetical protein
MDYYNRANELKEDTIEIRRYLHKNAEVGYTLPESISKKIGASNVRFYLSGNNLYTWTHLKTDSFDPEQNSPAAYPTMRTYNVGLNITF